MERPRQHCVDPRHREPAPRPPGRHLAAGRYGSRPQLIHPYAPLRPAHRRPDLRDLAGHVRHVGTLTARRLYDGRGEERKRQGTRASTFRSRLRAERPGPRELAQSPAPSRALGLPMGPTGSGRHPPVGSPGGGAPQSMFGSAMAGPARSLPSLRKNPGIVVELAGENRGPWRPHKARGRPTWAGSLTLGPESSLLSYHWSSDGPAEVPHSPSHR